MRNWFVGLLLPLVFCPNGRFFAQITVEGYVFEHNNRGYLNQVKVSAYELPDNILRGEVETGSDGFFALSLPAGRYRLTAQKDIFFERHDTVSVGKEKAFLKMELLRRPGYLFDATLAEMRESPDQIVDAVQGATVEIYNRSSGRTELSIVDDPDAFFQFTFERGNHYTLLIRKEGFLAKRIEVYVNVNGCILCVDGVRTVSPGVVDNLAAGHAEGTLLANIELERARLDKRIQIQNIYYDYDKWDIRPDAAERLDQVVTLMKDNPGISVELGSHTDSRGNDEYNQALSQRRAAAAVAYIISEGVDSARITARGYGESQLVNRCRNGVACSEEEHQQNRRTELRITGIGAKANWLTLEQIVMEEEMVKNEKGKKPPVRHLSEANTSAPLPAFNPVPSSPTPQNSPSWAPVRLLPLPQGFKGCAVELVRSAANLPDDHPAFAGQSTVFWLYEADGHYSYLLANLGPKEKATEFFKKKIRPGNKTARLVQFGSEGKLYLE